MIDSAVAERVQRLAGYLRENGGSLVCDADVHLTHLSSLQEPDRARYEASENYYHGRPLSAEDVVMEMDAAGVSMANIWQNPAATFYPGGEDANAESLLAANRYVFQSSVRYPSRFVASGWTDPKACGVANAIRIAETCVQEFGFFIVKMNPAQNRFPIDSMEVLQVVDRIVELGAVPAFHYGADSPFTPAEGLEKILLRHPGYPLVAVHMGGGGAGYVEAEKLYHQSRELGLRYPQLRYILSAKRDTHIESDLITYQLAGKPFRENLFCGSDAPYGRMSWNFGGYRAMFDSLQDGARHPEARVQKNPGLFDAASVAGYLGANFARFAADCCERMLHHHGVRNPANPVATSA